ncbi:MAG TPA: penicillin acylase family protein, partial [Terriglobales bacterium]|nr:penicillin acylase family protein [Terriglobales bacterium]
MSTTTSTLTIPKTRLRSAWRAAVVVALLLVVAAGAAAYWFYSAARAGLPQLDGTIVLRGLNKPVTVLRDQHGVPTIEAATLDDLFFAQGFITAQERLWSMDVYRRFASGELAAVLGSSYVKRDIYQRTLGFRQVAGRAVAALSPRDREYMEAYTRGVNAYIEQHQHALPVEFRVLRYFPRAWTVEDSFLVGTSLIEALNHGYYRAELDREKILARLGPELTNDLYVNTSFRDVPPGSDGQEIKAEPEQEYPEESLVQPHKRIERSSSQTRFIAQDATAHEKRAVYDEVNAFLSALDGGELRPGSNNWVVSGAHTASGKPLLCNDMHLGHRIPNVWYEAHLISGDYNVAGVTLPGVPFVIVGHNQRIAWGITNLGADVEDVFIENFNAEGRYQTPSGWQSPEVRHETIQVKGGKDVELDVVTTRHGPIITGLLNGAGAIEVKQKSGQVDMSGFVPSQAKGEQRMLALESVNWDQQHPIAFPFFDIDTATNWQQFTEALSRFPSPSENFVYADVDGHIGYHANGLIPIRAASDETLPVSGADDSHAWTGYIPFEKLPSVYDPPTGIIATANGRISPDDYPYTLSTEWVPPYRTERIYKLLHQDKKFAPADMLTLQTDVYSAFDRFMAERFVYAIDHADKPSARVKQAAEILRKWDGKMTIDSAGAAIARTSREQLQKMLLKSKLGDDVKLYRWQMSNVWLENVALHQPPRWLPKEFANYNELLASAVEKAISAPGAPRNLASWHYGDSFPIELSHGIFGRIPILKRWAGPGIQPQPGDGETVWQTGREFGPSERMTVDFSNFDNSTLNIVNGQSGHLLSRYFNDQWNAWY